MAEHRFKDNDDLFAAQATGLIQYLRANKARFGLTDAAIDGFAASVTPFPLASSAFKASVLDMHTKSLLRDDTKSAALKTLGTVVDNLGDKLTNADRVANGMPELTGPGGPRPVPTEVPSLMVSNGAPNELKVLVLDSANPTRRGKPADTDDADLRWDYDDGDVPPDFDDWHTGPTPSDLRSAVSMKFKPGNKGKSVLIVARYRNTNGEGPWSAPVSATIA